MPPVLYFQWQNEFLRRTIYPLRELKLRDFLVYEYEIAAWDEYKGKQLSQIPDQVQDYESDQARQRREAYHDYVELKAYFERPDIQPSFLARYPEPDPDELAALVWMHKAFSKYFSNYRNVNKERVFVAVRLQEMEARRKQYELEVPEIQRKLRNMGPDWVHTPKYSHRLDQLQTVTFKMLQEETTRLLTFKAALFKLEKRRKDLLAWQAELTRKQGELRYLLGCKKTELAKLEQRRSQGERGPVENQIAEVSVSLQKLEEGLVLVEHMLSLPEPEQMDIASVLPPTTLADIVRAQTSAYRASLEALDHDQLLERVVRCFLEHPTRYPLWLQYMVVHFSGMRYQSAHGSWADPRDMLSALAEKAISEEIQALDERAVEILCLEKVRCYVNLAPPPGPVPLAEQDYPVPPLAYTEKSAWKSKARLHLGRIQSYQLRVRITPGSGKTAANLYAKQGRDLVVTDQTAPKGAELQVELARLYDGQADGSEAFRILHYPGSHAHTGLYLLASEAVIVPNPYKRKSLGDLCVAEEHYRIEEILPDDQVLPELEAMQTRLKIPAWMWHEIVRLTELRTTRVENEHWESLSPAETEQLWAYRDRAYRILLEKWKAANLVGWREEHDRTNRLVVSRAVCNEVAEHILHLRGHSPAGGLTARPPFYLKKIKDPRLAGASPTPYFVKARSITHFTPGASLLWLRFVEGKPNQWRIAHPISLPGGESLLTPEVEVPRRGQDDEEIFLDLAKVGQVSASSPWTFYQTPNGSLKRQRTLTNTDGDRFKQDEWLRWMHEATIVKAAETVDGPTVLTFETALPYEDRRRSTIGVFKHAASDLLFAASPSYFNGAFLGYVPDQAPPLEDLRHMLDWNKIMLQPDYLDPVQTNEFWNKVLAALPPAAGPRSLSSPPGRPPAGRSRDFDDEPETALDQVEVAPPFGGLPSASSSSIPVFEIDAQTARVEIYAPEMELLRISLPRGTRLLVDKSAQVSASPPLAHLAYANDAGKASFFPIRQSHSVPHAQDLYVLAAHIIDAPTERADLPVRLMESAPAWRILDAAPGGEPVFTSILDNSGRPLSLPDGTYALLSGVHRLTPADTGGGQVHSVEGAAYYLVLEYPYQPSLRGCFVAASQVEPVSIDAYLHSIIDLLNGSDEMQVKVVPLSGLPSAPLYLEPGGSPYQSELPAGAALEVSTNPYFTPGEVYYRIAACASDEQAVGKYINTVDVVMNKEFDV